jgi:hypothetical protein
MDRRRDHRIRQERDRHQKHAPPLVLAGVNERQHVSEELIELVRQLKRELPRPSLPDISDALFGKGYATPLGKPYSASAVRSMLG